jgi:hypothetical protein
VLLVVAASLGPCRGAVLVETSGVAEIAADANGAELPPGWLILQGGVAAAAPLTLTMYVRQPAGGQEAVAAAAREVSDPDHPRYGAYLARDAVAAATAPNLADLAAVAEWAALSVQSNSTRSVVTVGHHTVQVRTTAATAERLCRMPRGSFVALQHSVTLQTVVRAPGVPCLGR